MSLSPKEIVSELDKYIIGQEGAKKAVAVALRNRYRRNQLSDELREEITPKNILMKGPTGVGKTEIARRLAKLVDAPFVKVEATKYSEVGYVGRNVESMVKDLVEVSRRMVKQENSKKVEKEATEKTTEKLIDSLVLAKKSEQGTMTDEDYRNYIKQNLLAGLYESVSIEINASDIPKPPQPDLEDGIMEVDLSSLFNSVMPNNKKKTMLVKEARKLIVENECDKLIDNDVVNASAIKKAEQEGIIFIDEIDKIANKNGNSSGMDVSREGVQRDILPIVEGCTVNTKYGVIKTDYILFIASGAFQVTSVNDLIPELQGRFPIRVELDNLTKDDFYKILTQTKNAITMQYEKLLEVDKIKLTFEDDALKEIANLAEKENETSENIGARRLHTIMEELLQDVSYNAGNNETNTELPVNITKEYVDNTFNKSLKELDLKKYIL
jgi:ATP-dependent HslUV protease ATP-binding subunit HslU